jgi:GNAT superfamily N-acetyltransferase
MTIMQPTLALASEADLGELLPMVARYHETERIASSPEERTRALLTLLRDPKAGVVWLIRCGKVTVGYIAVCLCYSIEFGGYDSFIDEFFIKEGHRGQGIGTRSLENIVPELQRQGIRAVSLEVGNANESAKGLYARCGFEPRDRYSVMTRLL